MPDFNDALSFEVYRRNAGLLPPSQVFTANGQVLAVNNSRRGYKVQNNGTVPVFLLNGLGAAANLYTVIIPAGTAANDGVGGFYTDTDHKGAVSLFASGALNVVVSEY
jgi:hypothetical protein